MPTLSIIVTARLLTGVQHALLQQTLVTLADSLRPSDPVEILLIDDQSKPWIDLPAHPAGLRHFHYHNTPHPLGVAGARQFGAAHAKGDWMLFVDAHMIFPRGWLPKFWAYVLSSPPDVLWCGTFVPSPASQPIAGAEFFFSRCYDDETLKFVDLDPIPEKNIMPSSHGVPAVLGASYFIHRQWFAALKGFEGLQVYGGDEAFLSLKSWLAGGSVRVMRDVRIAHVSHPKPALPADQVHWLLFNKLFTVATLFDRQTYRNAAQLCYCSPYAADALFEIDRAADQIRRLNNYFAEQFTRDLDWLAGEFMIETPAEILAMGVHPGPYPAWKVSA